MIPAFPLLWRTRKHLTQMAHRLPSIDRMARRNRDWNIAIAAGQLAALAVVVTLVSPQLRDKVQGVSQVAVILFAMPIAGLICGLVVALGLTRSRCQHSGQLQPSAQPAIAHPASTGSGDLRDHIRALDWYQFEKLVALVYRKQGFTVTRRGGAKADGGD